MGKLAWYHASPWISIYYGKTEWDSKVMLMAKSLKLGQYLLHELTSYKVHFVTALLSVNIHKFYRFARIYKIRNTQNWPNSHRDRYCWQKTQLTRLRHSRLYNYYIPSSWRAFMSCTNERRDVFMSGFSEPNQTPQSSKFFFKNQRCGGSSFIAR